MSGRPPVPRTRFARVKSGDPGVTVIRISGSLGPRAKPQLVRLTQECLRRNLPRLVLDLSEVDALGGGTARLLNEFAAERGGRGGKTAFRVTSRTVRGFLCADPNLPPPPLVASLEEAIAQVRAPALAEGSPGAAPVALPAVRGGSLDSASAAPRAPSNVPSRFGAPPPRPAPPLLAPEGDDVLPPDVAGDVSGFGALHSLGAPAADGDVEPVFELDPTDAIDEGFVPSRPLGRKPSRALEPEELRERLASALHARGVASRVFLFQRHPDRRYYLVTRQGHDLERGIDAHGALASCVGGLQGPGFLVDLDVDALGDHEVELLGELNCEVAVPLGGGESPEFLVFLSKEQPGEEYTLDELQELETVLGAATAQIGSGSAGRDAAGAGTLRAPAPPALWADAPTTAPEDLWDDDAVAVEADAPAAWPTRAPRVTEAPPPLAGTDDDPLFGAGAAGAPVFLPPAEETRARAPRLEFLVPEPERPAPIHVQDPSVRRPATPDATRALRRTVAQMRDILSLSQDFDAAFGTSKLLEVLVLSVVSVARAETVLYFAFRDGDYRLTHQRGMSPDAIQGLRLRGDASLVQRALASARGVAIGDDAQITEEERIWARQQGLLYAVPFRFKDEVLGLVLLGDSTEDAPPDLEMLGYLLAQAGLAYDRARLYETLQDRTLGVVRGLITLIEARSGFDCGSTEQVVRYAQSLARELQFPAEAVRDLIYGAVLRDVGMLQVSETLLRSAADLTGDQWEAIRRHPQEGSSIMRQMRFSPVAIDVVMHHHEAYNGEGYPMGLRGRAIPLGARIVAVAESYVKMTMDRPYRKALGKAEALESLAENWGLRYDPLVVDALVRVVNRELSMGLKGDRDLTRDLFGV